MAGRPGVMLYFELLEPIKSLSYEDKGKLFEAILSYAQYGEVPNFDGFLMLAWGFIRPKLDADARRYEDRVLKTTYSSYCAKEKKKGLTPKNWDDWLTERYRSMSGDAERYPTTAQTQNQIQNQSQQQPQTQTQPQSSTAAAAATYDGAKSDPDFDREERIRYLRKMLRLYQSEILCDPEQKEMFQSELDQLLQGADQ